MSITLPIENLAAAVAGTTNTISWAAQAGGQQSQATNDNPARMWLFNESPCGLQLNFQTGEQPFLPAGGWLSVILQPSCMQYTYTVAYVMTGPLVTSLVTVWFGPGEQVPNVPILGNSPIGGTVTGGTASNLLGTGQSISVTESDNGTAGATLVPTINGKTLTLSALTNIGNRIDLITVDGQNQAITLLKAMSAVNGQTAVGNMGVAVVVAKTTYPGFSVGTTGLKLVLSYTPTASGFYRISSNALINNSVSGQLLTLQLNWTDQNGNTLTRALSALSGGTTQQTLWAGANSIINSSYAIETQTVVTSVGAVISVQFNDPGGAPNDLISVIIERLD